MGVLKVIAKRLDAIVGPGVMLLYPLYASIRAIESPSMLDDQQWLTYWIIYSFLTLFELSCWKILAWLPFWPYMKLVFCMWLVLPIFNGAAYIYDKYIRKYINLGGFGSFAGFGGSNISNNYTEEQRKILQMINSDARKYVADYIDKHGWPAFERIIKVAEREAKKP
ncbi:TB2/DP1/HVA22-related protein [Corchorus capsularis]|uniref:HVA22-like protein n=2 Tax=Corchorus TaxID=93758 RepID=A0A1R3GTX8_COCAP|nr:TB2/DP1/HVA22-related protein [Corchorus olitorius]OMO61481.1 TB2/DP1/HVA22-related protein [Corchorus capsularis]